MTTIKHTPIDQELHIKNLVYATMTAAPYYRFTGMGMAERIYDLYGIKTDWHACSEALHDLCSNNKIDRIGNTSTGLALYCIA